MSLTQEQFDALDKAAQEYMIKAGLAPSSVAVQPTRIPPPAPGIPNLDEIPEQSSKGPEWIPYDREFDFECVLDQVKHRPETERSSTNFYAVVTITKASHSAQQAGILEGTQRAWSWYYNVHAKGKEQDKSKAALARYRDWVRQVTGATSPNEASAKLIADSLATPSLGIRLRAISVRGNERKNDPGKYFYNQTVIRL